MGSIGIVKVGDCIRINEISLIYMINDYENKQ